MNIRAVNRRFRMTPALTMVGVIIAFGGTGTRAAQQQPPPIQGVTGTIATDTSVQETTAGGNRVLGTLGRLFGLKRSAAPNDAAAREALSGLKKGTRIVLEYPVAAQNGSADQPAKQVDAEVVAVNRDDWTVAVALEDGTRQTLGLADPGEAAAASIFVYYRDRPGQRIAHAFKRIS